MMFEDEYIDVDSEIKVRRPAPSDDASHWMRPVSVCKVDNVESHALSSTTLCPFFVIWSMQRTTDSFFKTPAKKQDRKVRLRLPEL